MATPKRRTGLPKEAGTGPSKVWVGPRADKGGVVYLRWRKDDRSNWRWKSLKFTLEGVSAAERTAREVRAFEAAMAQFERLTGRRAGETSAPTRVVRLRDAWAIISDAKSGRYPTDSVYRRELASALAHGARFLGDDFPWTAFDRVRLREVTRRRASEVIARNSTGPAGRQVGFRAAQVLGTRLCTIARVLQEEGHLPAEYDVPGGKTWVSELRSFVEDRTGAPLPAPHRPRYTLDEVRQLLAVAYDVEPRFGLMLHLGAQLRAGQVARLRRSHLTLDPAPGTMQVHGKGKKQGTVLPLTAGQREILDRALAGYLVDCESRYQQDGTDYLLFPGTLRKGFAAALDPATTPVQKNRVNDWQREAEIAAGIPHVDGRSWYGSRRGLVDGSLDAGISGEALETLGGWSSRRVADEVYRERNRQTARVEASAVLAALRGEAVETPAAFDESTVWRAVREATIGRWITAMRSCEAVFGDVGARVDATANAVHRLRLVIEEMQQTIESASRVVASDAAEQDS